MAVAIRAADPSEPETVGWCRVRLGVELMSLGHLVEAEREFDLALENFPTYHVALAAKGRARAETGDLEGAASYYRKSLDRVPLPDTAIVLGDVLTKLGRGAEAARCYALAEAAERAGGDSTYSRQLALFWADRGERLEEAVAIVRREREARSDIYTCDALAWCLFKAGDLEGARRAISEALRLGTRDAQIFYHAGMISEALGERSEAKRYLTRALEIRVSVGSSTAAFGVLQADAARAALERLAGA
jgi:tetratricopeptide (TPR) repeat protein